MIRYPLLLLAVAWLAACSSSQPKNQNPAPAVSAQEQASPPVADPSLIPPEIVRLERIDFAKGVKNVMMSNTVGKYALACDAKVDSCASPSPARDYLLFNKNSKWKFRDSEDYVTLDFAHAMDMAIQGRKHRHCSSGRRWQSGREGNLLASVVEQEQLKRLDLPSARCPLPLLAGLYIVPS